MRSSTTVELGRRTATGMAVPAEVVEALDAEPGARARFAQLSYSARRRHVLAVEGAKAEATRQRRVAAVVDTFRAGADRAG